MVQSGEEKGKKKMEKVEFDMPSTTHININITPIEHMMARFSNTNT